MIKEKAHFVQRVARDVKRGYYTADEAEAGFGVVLNPETLTEDEVATRAAAGKRRSSLRDSGFAPARDGSAKLLLLARGCAVERVLPRIANPADRQRD